MAAAAPPLTQAQAGGLCVLRTENVEPAGPALPERAFPLTFLDMPWVHALPVERIFFYRLGTGADDVDTVLSHMVDSLSRTLHDFYPLAGRLRLTPSETNKYELFYQPGDGVAFTVAEHDGISIDEVAKDDPKELAKICQFLPELPKGGAVLALQATVLPPNRRGLVLGVTIHHSACDGKGTSHFLHTWAATCAGADVLPEPPVVDRTVNRHRNDIGDKAANKVTTPTNAVKEPPKSPEVVDAGKLLATFTLSRERLQSIKDAVAGEAARRGVPPPRCTSVVATYGLMWHCIRRARLDLEAELRCDGRTFMIFSVDHRSRLEPRVPDEYLGNCTGPAFASATRKELAANGADGLFAACSAVAAAIDEAVRGEPSYWAGWLERILGAKWEDPLFSVAGSARFCMYEVDFGFGRPVKLDIVSAVKSGSMSVAEERVDGGSGIEVGIALTPDHMERFRRCLADSIAWLLE